MCFERLRVVVLCLEIVSFRYIDWGSISIYLVFEVIGIDEVI